MEPTVDNKRYATDTRSFRDAVLQDGYHRVFEDSPITRILGIRDVCVYRDGVKKTAAELAGVPFDPTNPDHYSVVPDLNKIGKIGRTSWDSFSYALLMAHNVWMHIESVQRANREFDSGIGPEMLLHPRDTWYDFAAVVDRVFRARDRQKSLAIIDDHANIWQRIIGTRGYTGDRAVRSEAMFNRLFEIDDDTPQEPELDPQRLEELEEQQDV